MSPNPITYKWKWLCILIIIKWRGYYIKYLIDCLIIEIIIIKIFNNIRANHIFSTANNPILLIYCWLLIG